MATIAGQNVISVSFTQVGAIGIGSAATLPAGVIALKSTFANAGILLDQCDVVHAHPYILSASTPVNIDWTSFTDVLGNAASFARIRFLMLRLRATNDAFTALLGGAGSNEWNGWLPSASKATLFPSSPSVNDGFLIVQAPNTTGMPVSSGSRLFKLDPGANAVTVDVVAAGCSA